METVEIYALICPLTNEIRYIGKAKDSKKRLKSHLSDSKTRRTPVYDWMNKLKSKGLIPIVQVLKVTDENNWMNDEIELIKTYKNKGCRLLNVAKGGDEPYCPIEVRRQNGKNVAKSIHSDEKKKKLWLLKHNLALGLKWLEKHGRSEHATQIRERLKQHNIYL